MSNYWSTKTYELDPEWTVCRHFECGHVEHACCAEHLSETCPICS